MPEEAAEQLVALRMGIRQQMGPDSSHQLVLQVERTQGSPKALLQTLLSKSLATGTVSTSSTQPGCRAEAALVQESRSAMLVSSGDSGSAGSGLQASRSRG